MRSAPLISLASLVGALVLLGLRGEGLISDAVAVPLTLLAVIIFAVTTIAGTMRGRKLRETRER